MLLDYLSVEKNKRLLRRGCQLDSKKILLIESEEADAKIVMKFLLESNSPSFQVAHVKTLGEAIEKIRQESFEIVLMNLMLPDSGGVYGLTKLLERNSDLPVIVINGPNDDSLFENAIISGAQDYLSKGTIGTHSLRRSIVAALLRGRIRQDLKSHTETEGRSKQISSLAHMAKDMANDLEKPISAMKMTLGELRTLTEKRDELSPKEVRHILQEAESISDDFTTILADLRQFWRDLASDPLFKGRDRRSYRILCVDDEPEILEIMVDSLKAQGYGAVDTALNGLEAYNKAIASLKGQHRYDLIISDWKMPRMTGIELLEKLRSNHFFHDIPFMMLTALDDRERIEQAARARVSDYCIKPFERESLPKRVDRIRLLGRAV